MHINLTFVPVTIITPSFVLVPLLLYYISVLQKQSLNPELMSKHSKSVISHLP